MYGKDTAVQQVYTLDNAAKLFPAVASRSNTSVFRIAAIMKEWVDASALQKATDNALKRYPFFAVGFRQGLFWNYMKSNSRRLLVQQESQYPCASMHHDDNEGFFLRVLYFGNRIAVEFFHSLTDGFGGIEFLKTLLFEYLRECGEALPDDGTVRLPGQKIPACETEDSFAKHLNPLVEPNKTKPGNAYRVRGTPYEHFGHGIIHGVYDAAQLARLAKQRQMTLTQLFCASLAYAVAQSPNKEDCPEPVVLSVPVNLRSFFPSGSLRNFFCITNINIPGEGGERSFDETAAEIRKEFDEKVKKDYLESVIKENHNVLAHPLVRFAPLFLKHAGTKFVFAKWAEKNKTATVSNLGVITMPEAMEKYVERMETVIYPTPGSPLNCCICSAAGKLTVSFSSSIREKDIIRCFFMTIAKELGLCAELYSNEWS
ncbi:alcohol acetyltransferase [Christensenellaceae bacterium OttesenSCG-928-K19]|nr:alcohol acetyltransferase [Christensenellaceae bacterium OttesenSCG-928-K19]